MASATYASTLLNTAHETRKGGPCSNFRRRERSAVPTVVSECAGREAQKCLSHVAQLARDQSGALVLDGAKSKHVQARHPCP